MQGRQPADAREPRRSLRHGGRIRDRRRHNGARHPQARRQPLVAYPDDGRIGARRRNWIDGDEVDMMKRGFMKKLAVLIFALSIPALAQVNLDTTIPAPQVKGILRPANGGFGITTAGLTGCPRVDSGVWSISPANCVSSALFSILSFTGCNGTFELGATITSPTCSATYSAMPTSAAITNTDAVSSPTNLVSPFTSATITGNFVHTAATTTTFTLTAVGTSTQTATQTYQWKQRIFDGVGTAGATSTVTASGTTAILSTTDVLGSIQLGPETVGQTFAPLTPSGQVIYLFLAGGSHTFVDANTGFPMAFNAPTTVTFHNVNGVVITMYLYQTTYALYGSYAPRVAS